MPEADGKSLAAIFYCGTKGKEAKEKLGPVGITRLKELYAEGEINKESRAWAQGMDGWRPIRLG